MWEIIRKLLGWRCKRDNIFKNWWGGRFRLIVGSHFKTLIVWGGWGSGEMWELRISAVIGDGCVKDKNF